VLGIKYLDTRVQRFLKIDGFFEKIEKCV
jgi:hypothetical protein